DLAVGLEGGLDLVRVVEHHALAERVEPVDDVVTDVVGVADVEEVRAGRLGLRGDPEDVLHDLGVVAPRCRHQDSHRQRGTSARHAFWRPRRNSTGRASTYQRGKLEATAVRGRREAMSGAANAREVLSTRARGAGRGPRWSARPS